MSLQITGIGTFIVHTVRERSSHNKRNFVITMRLPQARTSSSSSSTVLLAQHNKVASAVDHHPGVLDYAMPWRIYAMIFILIALLLHIQNSVFIEGASTYNPQLEILEILPSDGSRSLRSAGSTNNEQENAPNETPISPIQNPSYPRPPSEVKLLSEEQQPPPSQT